MRRREPHHEACPNRFRDSERARRAFAEIWEAIDKEGHRVDRYASVRLEHGLPARPSPNQRSAAPGFILRSPRTDRDDQHGPVAPHFGDFVIARRRVSEHHRGPARRLDVGRQSRQYFAFRQRIGTTTSSPRRSR